MTIEAREQGDGTSVGRLSVTVNVTNVDEPGMVEVPVSEPRVGQLLTATVSDQDGGVGSIEWKWERRPSGGDRTPIPGATTRSYTPAREDNGHDLRVTAICRDGHGPGKAETYQFAESVELRSYFEADTAARSIQENTPEDRNVGSRFTARHPDNVNLTYFLAGADGIYIDIDETNGQLETSNTPLDYETLSDHQAEVEITATDSNGQAATISVNVAATDECRTAGEPALRPRQARRIFGVRDQPPRGLVSSQDSLRHIHYWLRPAISGVRSRGNLDSSEPAWNGLCAYHRESHQWQDLRGPGQGEQLQQRIRRVVPVRHRHAGIRAATTSSASGEGYNHNDHWRRRLYPSSASCTVSACDEPPGSGADVPAADAKRHPWQGVAAHRVVAALAVLGPEPAVYAFQHAVDGQLGIGPTCGRSHQRHSQPAGPRHLAVCRLELRTHYDRAADRPTGEQDPAGRADPQATGRQWCAAAGLVAGQPDSGVVVLRPEPGVGAVQHSDDGRPAGRRGPANRVQGRTLYRGWNYVDTR